MAEKPFVLSMQSFHNFEVYAQTNVMSPLKTSAFQDHTAQHLPMRIRPLLVCRLGLTGLRLRNRVIARAYAAISKKFPLSIERAVGNSVNHELPNSVLCYHVPLQLVYRGQKMGKGWKYLVNQDRSKERDSCS